MAINGEKVLMLSVMRNEGPYILEWLAHHFALGVDDLLIFTNNCTDNTDRILDRVEKLMPHRVKHQPNPKIMFPDRGRWHVMALRFAGHFGRYREADWLYVTDADEFLNFHGDIKTFDDFFRVTGAADAVSFTSVPFSSGGQKHAHPELVTKRFTQTTRDYESAQREGQPVWTAVKTLYRNSIEGARRPHRPVTPKFSSTQGIWINGSGEKLGPEFTDGHNKTIDAVPTRAFAQVNHYVIKSAAEFILKAHRGDAVMEDRLGQSPQYWAHADIPGGEDRSLVGLSEDAQSIYDTFMEDAELRTLHEESFAIREATLKSLLNTPWGKSLARAIGYEASPKT